MKRTSLSLLCITCGTLPGVSHADNINVENALRSRSDLTYFYQALVNTGVNHELKPNVTYTIFAPTNAAIAEIRKDQYPCFYMSECRAEVAHIVRNHIIPTRVTLDDAIRQKGGLYAMDGRFVTIGEPSRNDYAISGQNIIYTSSFRGGTLYKIDGVIASRKELAGLQFADYVSANPHVNTRTTMYRTIPDPACGPRGCPDAATQVTTITHVARGNPSY